MQRQVLHALLPKLSFAGDLTLAVESEKTMATPTDDEALLTEVLHHITALMPDGKSADDIGIASLTDAAQVLARLAATGCLENGGAPEPPALRVRYSVLATARSGSTWFSELLQSTGAFGRPKEYIRAPHVFLARNAAELGISFRDVLEELALHNAVDGVFGAKHIDDFFLPAFRFSGAAENAETAKAFLGDRIILYRRSDQVAQAVSKFIAEEVKVWHVRDDRKRERYEQKLEAVAYDAEKISGHLDDIRTGEEELAKIAAQSGLPVRTTIYEDLLADTEAGFSGIAAFLDGPVEIRPEQLKSRVKPLQSQKAAEFIARFRKGRR